MPRKNLFILWIISIFSTSLCAQQITGVWEGRINNNKVEVKIIQKGDSLTGTSYYYASNGNYRRYTIKGYFDQYTNEVIWWDDQLINDQKSRSVFSQGHVPLVSRADFNCPGGAKMMLEGKSTKKEDDKPGGKVYLEKSYDTPVFPDEWDFVIDNYTVGGNDPYIIDSIGMIAFTPAPSPKPVIIEETTEITTRAPVEKLEPLPQPTLPVKPITIEQKFTIRKKVFTAEIPLEGDTIELRFFDNVQVDGDSITLFLNEKMIFTHIRLTEKPFVVKLPVSELHDSNELTMVAENLGAVPPNTAYMVAIVNGKRHEINLSSTEETSGMIRLIKPGAGFIKEK